MSEQEIIEKIRNGDMKAFDELYSRYKKQTLQMAYLMTGNQSMAMDIVQEAFVECYLSLGRLKESAYFGTWFYRITTRTAWRYIKREKRLVPVEKVETIIEAQEHYYDDYMQSDLSDFIISQINKMDYKKRTTLILHYYNELSIKEIAKVMGCCTGTVKSRLNSGRRELKKYLIKEHYMEGKERGISYEVVTEHRA